MKDAKKSTNIHIREHSKHSSRAESSKLKPMGPVNHDSRNSKRTTVTKVELPLELKR